MDVWIIFIFALAFALYFVVRKSFNSGYDVGYKRATSVIISQLLREAEPLLPDDKGNWHDDLLDKDYLNIDNLRANVELQAYQIDERVYKFSKAICNTLYRSGEMDGIEYCERKQKNLR